MDTLTKDVKLKIIDWESFIDFLDKEVDWEDPSMAPYRAVEQALLAIAAHPEALENRTRQIVEDKTLFDAYAPHMNYPRILMDKFMLYMDPADRFRVRLHRFKTKRQNGTAVEKVHSHKWPMSTIILRGTYEERVFNVDAIDEEAKTAKLTMTMSHTLSTGAVNSLPAYVPHQVFNHSDDEPVFTLFVRGPSLGPAASIFDVEKGTYYQTFDPNQQLKEGLLAIGRLDADFH